MATIIEKLEAASVVDSLLRTENPLSNAAAWHKVTTDKAIGRTTASEGWQPVSTFGEGADGAQFDDVSFLQKVSGGIFTYNIGTISLSSGNSAERFYALWALVNKAAFTGYRFKMEMTATGKYKISLERWEGGSLKSTIATTSNFSMSTSAGAVCDAAIVVGEGKVRGYVKKSGGSWELALEGSDSTYTEGYAAMEGKGNFMRLKNFKVGTFTLAEPKAPVVTTEPADNIGPSKAELHGEVDPEGEKAEWWFEYGPTESYGFQSPLVPPKTASAEAPEDVATSLSGLTPGTKYHFRVVAKNGKGETKGADQEFETAAANTVGAKVGGVVVPAVRYVKVGGEVIPA